MKKVAMVLSILFIQRAFSCDVEVANGVAMGQVNDLAKSRGAVSFVISGPSFNDSEAWYNFSYFFHTKSGNLVSGMMKVDQRNCNSTVLSFAPASEYSVQ